MIMTVIEAANMGISVTLEVHWYTFGEQDTRKFYTVFSKKKKCTLLSGNYGNTANL